MIKKLYSAMYRDDGYPFNAIASECVAVAEPDQIDDPSGALIVWGGADINPALYKHPQSRTTYPGGKRDDYEWALMQKAIEIGAPIIGVCRGAQMACAAAGGFLLQDVRNHAGYHHKVTTKDGRVFQTNSIHHQMMIAPEGVDHELLAWSTEPLSTDKNGNQTYVYKNDLLFEIPVDFKEPEFYYFPKIKAFAIQWHPEAMDVQSEATQYILETINERLGV